MKQKLGWLAAGAVAITAFVGLNSPSGQPGSGTEPSSNQAKTTPPKSPVPKAKKNSIDGACLSLEERLQAFLLVPADQIATPSSCYGTPTKRKIGNSARLIAKAAKLNFVIAFLPDPLHTHFPLVFDRLTEAIQQGAQDEKYLYDSSWLPWETEEQTPPLVADEDELEDRKEARENQPGILLFRNNNRPQESEHSDPATADGPYSNGLVVFVVGEEPTGGIHRRQFENAMRWVHTLQPRDSLKKLKFLGPTFSGSIDSLAQLLSEHDHNGYLAKKGATRSLRREPLTIYSGTITSESAVRSLLALRGDSSPVDFRTFQESDSQLLYRYADYLVRNGSLADLRRLAILSEDETAYGGDVRPKLDLANHRSPLVLYYPRDISALRDAYQKQSIFYTGSTQQAANAISRTLTNDLADPEGKEHDTIQSYSGDQTALSQEAVLQQVVSQLQAHRSEYIVVRSSNPIDILFLSHYLRLKYPAGRIVIDGSDLLLRREGSGKALSGIMTLTTYPLLPWQPHWENRPLFSQLLIAHSHRIFAQDLAEGEYVATRFLLKAFCENPFPGTYCTDNKALARCFLPPYFHLIRAGDEIPIRDYSPPCWAPASRCSEIDQSGANVDWPRGWLSVLGRNGVWPIASLTTGQSEQAGIWQRLRNASTSPFKAFVFWTERNFEGAYQGFWPPLPVGFKCCFIALCFGAAFHYSCCLWPSLRVGPGFRSHFVRTGKISQTSLLTLGTAFIALCAMLLGCAFGITSPDGVPFTAAILYRPFMFLVWGTSVLALVGNTLRCDENSRSLRKLRNRSEWKKDTKPAIVLSSIYAGFTYLLFVILDFVLEEPLVHANRFPAYWRSVNLASGMSPLLPLLVLVTGMYLWFWHALKGMALFNRDRPRLPRVEDLEITGGESLPMFSEKGIAEPIEALCDPLSFWVCLIAGTSTLLSFGITWLLSEDLPIRSLSSAYYACLFLFCMCTCSGLILANCWQLSQVWLKLRQLLTHLDRLHLRRTMEALKGYSWGSIWKMGGFGGNLLAVRYKFLSRQVESLDHFISSLGGTIVSASAILDDTLAARAAFTKWHIDGWNHWRECGLDEFEMFQKSLCKTAGVMLAKDLIPHWRIEKRSLLLENSSEDKNKEKRTVENSSRSDNIRNAEEFVCLVYLGFVLNILGRMRTLVMQILVIFVAMCISVSTYPFDPRPSISVAMFFLFSVIGTVIVVVYSQMHRDATLSLVTNTTPGELGGDFWFKLIGVLAGPVLGLLAAIFPELPGSIFSIFQAGSGSVK